MEMKPEEWDLDPELVDPDWEWFWRDHTAIIPFWEGGGAPFNYSNRQFLTPVNSPTWGPTSKGIAGITDGTTEHWELGQANLIYPSTNKVTIAVLRRPQDTQARTSMLFSTENQSDNRADRIGSHAPLGGDFFFDYGHNRLTFSYTKTVEVEALVYRGGTLSGTQVWSNGVQLGALAAPGTVAVTADDQIARINSGSGLNGDLLDFLFFGVWDKEWSDQQIKQWSENPYGPITMADDYPVWMAALGGGSVLPQLMRKHVNTSLRM